jgi:hypothetical protein
MSAVAGATLCASMALTGCGKASHTATASSASVSAIGSQPPVASSAAAPSSAAPPLISAPAPETSAPAPASSAPPAASPAPDPQLLAINLQPADLPGWTGGPDTSDGNDAANNAALAKCVGGRDTQPDLVADVTSQEYTLANATISSDASRYRSQADLTADTAIIKSPKLSSCYDQLLRTEMAASLPGGTTLNSESIVVAPGSAGIRSNVVGTAAGKVNISSGGETADVFVNVAFITGPLIEAEVDFLNVGAPVPATVRNALIAKVAARAAGGKAA